MVSFKAISLALVASVSAVQGFQINFYSDTECQNFIGHVGGGSSATETAFASIECNRAPYGAHSFISMVDQCQLGVIHFGGQRKMGKKLCALNGFMCQWSHTWSKAHNVNNCQSYNGQQITGWQVQFNMREGNCPPGFTSNWRRDLPNSELPQSLPPVDATPEINWEEAIEELKKRGPNNEAEAKVLERRQKMMC